MREAPRSEMLIILFSLLLAMYIFSPCLSDEVINYVDK